MEDPGGTLSLNLKFAPSFSHDLLKSEGDRLSEFQTTSLSLDYTSSADKGAGGTGPLVLDTSLALKADTDFDADSASSTTPSALVGDFKLNWKRGTRYFSPFVGYKFEAGFDRFLRDYKATDHVASAGVNFIAKDGPCQKKDDPKTDVLLCKVSLKPSVERTISSIATRERWTAKFNVATEGEAAPNVIWKMEMTFEYRSYDIANLEICSDASDPGTCSDKEWRYIGSASLDFAKLFDSSNRRLKNLSAGVRWNKVTRLNGKNKSSVDLLPMVQFSMPL